MEIISPRTSPVFFSFSADRGDDRASKLIKGEPDIGDAVPFTLNPTNLIGVAATEFSFSSLERCVGAVDGLDRDILKVIVWLLLMKSLPGNFDSTVGVEIGALALLAPAPLGGCLTAESTLPALLDVIGVETP